MTTSRRASLPTTIACTCGGAGARCQLCETLRETELGCDDRLDGDRPMPPPVRTPEDERLHARLGRLLGAAGMLISFVIVALLKWCGARSLNL